MTNTMANKRDPKNPYTATRANDKAEELVQVVIEWCRANRNVLNSTQQSAVITAITSVLDGTFNV
jgi:hypothetical protein